ncbi:MAG: MerR family transcriptional regulator [Desulfuromonadales bacterium]
MTISLPDKLYYKIGEVAEVVGVKTSVLRFWESEFSFLKPEKSTSGQRLYTKNEVDLVLLVKRMLYDDKYTLEGVKKRINSKGRFINTDDLEHAIINQDREKGVLKEIRQELIELRALL